MKRKTLRIVLLLALWPLPVRADELPDGRNGIAPISNGPVNVDMGPKGSYLIGFDAFLGSVNGNEVVQGLRPFFLNEKGGQTSGKLHGKVTGHSVSMRAKSGYAVGAITLMKSDVVEGFSVTYMKLDQGRLDVTNTEESTWAGGRMGAKATHVGGTGLAVVGLLSYKNSKAELSRIGLAIAPGPIGSTAAAAADAMAPIVAEPAPVKRVAAPTEAAQAKALKLAKEVYGDQWAAAKTPEQKRLLAEKLLASADESENDAAARFVLLKLAKDSASQATNGQLAFQAIERMGKQFVVDEVEMKLAVLSVFAKRAKAAEEHKSIAGQGVGLIDQAIAHDNFDQVTRLCDLIVPESRAARDPDLVREVKSKVEQIKPLAKAYQEVKAASDLLDKTPDDPAANLLVGRYTCFVKGDWANGLSMLALGSDPDFKLVATDELHGAKTTEAEVRLGDRWWDLADKQSGKVQKAIRGRACFWYEKAVPSLAGLGKAKIEKRLKEYEAFVAASKDKKTEGVAESTIKRSSLKWRPGLVAGYYNDTRFFQPSKLRVDPTIDLELGYNESPDPAINSTIYGAYWQGYIKVSKPGRYTFGIHSNQGVRFVIDNVPIIDQIKAAQEIELKREVSMASGYRLITLQYLHEYGKSFCHLTWQPPGAASPVVVPASILVHDARQEQAAAGVGK